MSEKSKDTLDTVITVISKIHEGMLLAITVYLSQKRVGQGRSNPLTALVSFYTPSNNPVGTICPKISRKEEIHNEKT